MKKIIRNIIILAVVIVLGVWGYSAFFKKDTGVPASGLVTKAGAPSIEEGGTNGTVGNEFLTLLLNIRSIKLDDSIFTSKAFTALQDFSRPIPPDTNPGRQNPFAPIGVDTSSSIPQVSTSNPSSITATGSTLNGTLAVGGATTLRWFEYGPTQALGVTTPQKTQGTPGAFAEQIVGLVPNATYYVKAVASIGGVVTSGNVVTWKTAQKSTTR
jgi:hypothetical protein